MRVGEEPRIRVRRRSFLLSLRLLGGLGRFRLCIQRVPTFGLVAQRGRKVFHAQLSRDEITRDGRTLSSGVNLELALPVAFTYFAGIVGHPDEHAVTGNVRMKSEGRRIR